MICYPSVRQLTQAGIHSCNQGVIEKLEAELAAAKAEIGRLRADETPFGKTRTDLLESENARLREALINYGRCLCESDHICGMHAALSPDARKTEG